MGGVLISLSVIAVAFAATSVATGSVLTGMGVIGVTFAATSMVHMFIHAPTRRAYKELLFMVLHEFKEKYS